MPEVNLTRVDPRMSRSLLLSATTLLAALLGCGRENGGGKEYPLAPVAGSPTTVARWDPIKPANDAPQAQLNAIALESDGNRGWAVGQRGAIVHYEFDSEEQIWRTNPYDGLQLSNILSDVWVSHDGTHGWAVGHDVILRLQRNGAWVRHDPNMDYVSRYTLFDLWMSDDGARGWAVGYHGLILKYEQAKGWALHRVPSEAEDSLYAVWSNQEQTVSWAVGNHSILKYGSEESDAWATMADPEGFNPRRVTTTDGGRSVFVAGRSAFGIDVVRHLSAESVWTPILDSEEVAYAFLRLDGDQEHVWLCDSRGSIHRITVEERIGGPELHSRVSAWWSDAERAVVFGADGASLRYANGRWTESRRTSVPGQIRVLWTSADMRAAWASSSEGPLYQGQVDLWHRDAEALFSGHVVTQMAFDSSGKNGCAYAVPRGVSTAKFACRTDNRWRRLPIPVDSIHDEIKAVHIAPHEVRVLIQRRKEEGEGHQTRVVDTRAEVTRCDRLGDGWVVESTTDDFAPPVDHLWISGDASRGWAVGTDIFKYDRHGEQKWQRVFDGRHSINEIWIDKTGESGWAVGESGTVLQLSSGRWRKWPEWLPNVNLDQIRMNNDGTAGWALSSKSGELLEYANDRWTPVSRDEYEYEGSPDAICIADTNTVGLIYEGGEPALSLSQTPIGPVTLTTGPDFDDKNLAGSCTLSIGIDHPVASPPSLFAVVGSDWFELGAELEAVTSAEPEPGVFRYRLTGFDRAQQLAHERAAIRVEFELGSVQFPKTFRHQTGNVFQLMGPSPWIWRAQLATAWASFNLVIILLATRWSLARRVVLSPIGSHVIGLVIGKYLLIDFLVRFVYPLKLAMFRQFRRELANSQTIGGWEDRLYVPPLIEVPDAPTPRLDDERAAWEHAWDAILQQPRNRLWLILGESGLGKTALLEKWTARALESHRTPLLIRLGGGQTADEEAAVQMQQYGDLPITPRTALQLLVGGGFVILLDGFNEDTDPNHTREFVRKVVRRNWVVMTSQVNPRWGRILNVERITLGAFGREQLLQVFQDPVWVDRVLEAEHLQHSARLPQTAQLLADYVRRKQSLPRRRLNIYLDLYDQLQQSAEAAGLASHVLNLEKSAWGLFCENKAIFEASASVPKTVCEAGRDVGLLTRVTSDGAIQYRFRHELFARFFVARYVFRQEAAPLEDWHRFLQAGQGREFWSDVLEFWAELIVGEGESTGDYEGFLRGVAKFCPPIFRQRLYPQADRLDREGHIALSATFIRWAARFMAN